MKRRRFLQSSIGVAALSTMSYPLFSQGSSFAKESFVAEMPSSVFTDRLIRAQDMMREAKIDLLLATPGTNFAYFDGFNPWRSERLIALLIPREGNPVIVSPSFERERVVQRSHIKDIRTWEEDADPYALVGSTVASMGAAAGTIGVEPTTCYHDFVRLKDALPNSRFVDGSSVFDELRMRKSPEEIGAIRKAIAITLSSIAATHEQLADGVSEVEVSRLLSTEMRNRESNGGGLIQFGPSSALPHGGPTPLKLVKGTVVLIDAGCTIDGYTSDITRTIYWGAEPPAKYKEVFNVVQEAQQAAASVARPGVECQELDRVARIVIEKNGYGKYFTHRLGHGIGLDGHEHPYLVGGNIRKLNVGNTVTIEPGIYVPGEFGVRIEDDFLLTESGVEQLSTKVNRL